MVRGLIPFAVLAVLVVPHTVHGADRDRLDRAFEAAVGAGRWDQAASLGDSLVCVREARGQLAPLPAAALLDSLGMRLFRGGSPVAWAAAERLLRAGLARRERVLDPDDLRIGASLARLSGLLDYLGRWRDAIPLAERAVAIRSRSLGEKSPEAASSLRQLGLLWFQLGDYAAAAPLLERSLAIYEDLGAGFEAKRADGHNNLGELERVRNHLDQAEVHFQRGLDAAVGLPADHPLRLALANNLAGLYKDIGRLGEAEPLLESGLAVLESAGDPGALATAQLNLAEVRRLQGRAAEARPLYARALEGARRAFGTGHPDLILFLNQAAVCDRELGQFTSAESLFQETGAIVLDALGPDHPLLAQNLADIARLRIAAGKPADAESLLARAIALRERTLGENHPDVALLLVDQVRARAAYDREASAAPLARALAILDSTHAYPEARLDAYALRAELQAARGRRDLAIADMRIALAAMDSLRAWHGGGDETRVGFVAAHLPLLERMLGWQIDQGDVDGALATHECGRARALLDQIEAGGVDLRAGIPPSLLEPLAKAERTAEARLASAHRAIQEAGGDPTLTTRERMERVAALGARRDSAARELAWVRRRIEDASPLWREVLSADGGIPSVAELQAAIVPRHGLMLVYHVGRPTSWVFVVPKRGRVKCRPLAIDPESAAILGVAAGPLDDDRLERIMNGIGEARGPDASPGILDLLGGITAGGFVALPFRSAAGPDSFELRLHALWNTLVPRGLRARVLAVPSAVVIPDGPLHQIAFEALVTQPRGHSPRTHYWLDDGPALTYGPSATSLRSLALRRTSAPSPPSARPSVLSVSDVSYDPRARDSSDTGRPGDRTWSPLPGTAIETAAIREAFGPERVIELSGAGATEAAVRAALTGPRYVHIATHGFADRSGDRFSAGLVLATPAGTVSPGEDDGLLQLFEIHRLALTCELAVLSACATGRGKQVSGEGSFALSRAFLAAGAKRVVASLWSVDDRSTARVMAGLFRVLAGDATRGHPPTVAAALRDAKLAVRRDPQTADPFFWAPFVLSGP